MRARQVKGLYRVNMGYTYIDIHMSIRQLGLNFSSQQGVVYAETSIRIGASLYGPVLCGIQGNPHTGFRPRACE